ncbi:DUF3795 domain-containing protein [Clostridium sp. UBA7339]|uniref:DUF3795 domain-containing protein n=1 Tax=Clostridium sp. UBA7339 TaxID=1946376 RepID=UPI0032173331
MNITRCGYCCDLCKAFEPNIKENDQRKELSKAWKDYYELDILAEDIHCDGCRCEKENRKLIDTNCPVRKCVIEENLNHCGECNKYPCSTFNQRQGLSANEAKEKLGENYDTSKYNEYLLAYDNKSRIDEYKKNKF